MSGSSQNGLSELLQASYTLGGGQKGILRTFTYTLGGGENELSELLQASYTLGDGQKNYPNFYWPLTRAKQRSKRTL